VLREQLDFFEDELAFVRLQLQPGQKVVDIGANCGVYTLPMASRVGPGGYVWAFEPTSSTARFLAKGIAENGFGHVTLVQSAVSSAPGSAQISLQRHSELNSIIHGQPPTGESETVSVVSLDECMDRYRWTEIDLIKIDAEGEESNILKGGLRFFSELAPLVQYELKSATEMNFALIGEFAALGYDSYRLVPGLNILMPFDAAGQTDPYLLNLYCCKSKSADQLAARGLLIRSLDKRTWPNVSEPSYHWQQTLARLPYAAQLSPAWREAENSGNIGDLIQGLSFYARSRDSALSSLDRFRSLQASYLTLKSECEREPARLRLASLARAAHDYGARAVTVEALQQLLKSIRHAGVDIKEPFLAPLERFDSIPFGDEPARWLVAAVLEQLERRERFSSFYAGPSARDRLEDIHALGHGSPEMQRRLELVRQRFCKSIQPGPG
jgi:FkbM family methyltransferase